MKINDDLVKGHWRELKGEVQRMWGNVTDDELEATKGNVNSIIGLLQQKYAKDKDSIKDKVGQLMNRFTSDTRDKVEDMTKNDEPGTM
jgi:uncharacterized protein YjbJ (UPF0337 family)